MRLAVCMCTSTTSLACIIDRVPRPQRLAGGSDEQAPTLTLTIPQTAELLGISRSRTYEAARIGQIPTIRVGTRILVSGN